MWLAQYLHVVGPSHLVANVSWECAPPIPFGCCKPFQLKIHFLEPSDGGSGGPRDALVRSQHCFFQCDLSARMAAIDTWIDRVTAIIEAFRRFFNFTGNP